MAVVPRLASQASAKPMTRTSPTTASRSGGSRARSIVSRPGSARRRPTPSPDDEVDELPAARDDDPVRFAAGQDLADPVAREDGGFDVGDRRVGGDDDLVAQLAVDLDRDLAGRLGGRGDIELGPGLGVDRGPASHRWRSLGASTAPR